MVIIEKLNYHSR